MKRDTAVNWTVNNPVLLNGEIILVDTDSGELRAKVGDGTKTYTQLPFTDEILKNLITGKQNKLTGSQGQVVGFDAEGNAVAQEAPQTGLTQEQADQRYLQKTGGYASGTIGVTSGEGKLELRVDTSGETQTLVFLHPTAGGAYIRNTEGGIITIGSESGFRMNTRYKDLVLTGGNFVSATAPSDDDDLTNKAYVDSKTLAFGPQTVATSAWTSDSTYPDYPYRASIALSGVTANHVPSVNFNSTDALSGKLSPVSESYDGGVYIYATEALPEAVSVGSVTCIKAVSA